MKRYLFIIGVPVLATLLALAAGEGILRFVEKRGGPRFNGLSVAFGENFFFHHWKPGQPLYPTKPLFDRWVGWHAGPHTESPEVVFNSLGWRSRHEYAPMKNSKRVILIGDSFTYGTHLPDGQTIADRLQASLGETYQVLSFAAEGYGIDQMAVIATQLAPAYQPNAVIVAFIADDLRRTCTPFAWGQARKPYYELVGGRPLLRGFPVPQPEINARRHRRLPQRVTDALLTYLSKSRVINALASPYLQWREKNCLESLNAGLFTEIQRTLSPGTRLLFAHLDGDLPEGFRRHLKKSGIGYLEYREFEGTLAARLHLVPGRSDGYHPDAARAQVIASVYRDWLESGR